MLLTLLLLIPLIGAVVVALVPREEPNASRHVGMLFAVLDFLVACLLLRSFRSTIAGMQFEINHPWVQSWGIHFHLGIDGISLWLVMLTAFLTPLMVLSSYRSIDVRVKEFIVALLLMEMAMLGAFVALDLILFYVFWEIMLVPMYLIIGIWGHARRIYAAMKFFIFTVAGSLPMLAAIIYMYVTHGQATGFYTFDYLILNQCIWQQDAQRWLFLAFALAFAIKVPLFPFHTWLPDAHTEAPTIGSVVLAAVLLKMGTYGFLRFAMPLFPFGAATFGPYISLLAIVGIIYGAMVAYAQRDAKRLVAYSSVSHLGFVMLGLMAMNTVGVTGSIYQMVNHGISTGGLFLAIGILYDRRHTHDLEQFGGLWKVMPVFAAFFMLIMLSSAGLPGLNGFVGEFMILMGTFTHRLIVAPMEQLFLVHSPFLGFAFGPRTFAAIAALGVVLGAVYLLHLFQKLMFGPITQEKNAKLPDLSLSERFTFIPLLVLIVVMGVYPAPFLRRMEPAVDLFLKQYRVKFRASELMRDGPPQRLPELMHLAATTAATTPRGNAPKMASPQNVLKAVSARVEVRPASAKAQSLKPQNTRTGSAT